MLYPPDWVAKAIVIVPIAIGLAVLLYTAWRSWKEDHNE